MSLSFQAHEHRANPTRGVARARVEDVRETRGGRAYDPSMTPPLGGRHWVVS